MTPSPSVLRRRRAAAALLLGGLATVAVLLLAPSHGRGAADPAVVVQTDLGVPFTGLSWLGAPTSGATKEVEAVTGDGEFVRYTDDAGWSSLGRLDVAGHGPTATQAAGPGLTGHVTPRGGIGDVRANQDDGSVHLVAADPGADHVEDLPPIVDGDPADPNAPSLIPPDAGVFSYVATPLTPIDEPSGRTGLLFTPTPYAFPTGGQVGVVLHWDPAAAGPAASGWSAEPIDGAAGLTTLVPLAVRATAPDNAWLIARGDDGGGVLLFRRELRPAADGGNHWVRVDLTGSVLGPRDPSTVVVQPKSPPNDPLAVTPHGLWIDADVQRPGDATPSDMAVHLDASGAVDGSWCDVQVGGDDLCAAGLGVRFGGPDDTGSSPAGYRIVAFDPPDGASGPGTRITSNAGNGTYARFDGHAWTRLQGTGNTTSASAAFWSRDDGWLGGNPPRRVTVGTPAPPLQAIPVAARRPLLSAAPEPGHPAGALDAQAVGVGVDGTVVRYTPGQGWAPEILRQPDSADRQHVTLRAVAWPEPDYAVAVGDAGAIYSWTPQRGTWEPDDARPDDLGEALTGVAFEPDDPDRGYVVGRDDTLLRYDKTLTQEPLPSGIQGDDFVAIAFAGHDALVAATTVNDDPPARTPRPSDLLVNGGDGWHVDPEVHQLLADRPGATITTVAGLPDGGAVVAGHGFVAYRDAAGGHWRAVRPPAPTLTPVSAAAIRDGGQVRALLTVTTDGVYPAGSAGGAAPSPDVPPPPRGPEQLASDGWLLRDTGKQWSDEQHAKLYAGFSQPVRPDSVLALGAVGPDGSGWLLGGDEPLAGPADRLAGETAAIFRYPHDDAAAVEQSTSAVPLPSGPARLVVAGGAECPAGCWAYPNLGLEGDVMMGAARTTADALAARPHGPRAFLYTGAGLSPGKIGETQKFPPRENALPPAAPADEGHYAAGAAAGTLPFYAAPSAGELGGDGTLSAFSAAFAAFPAPFGTGTAPSGVTPVTLPADPAPAAGARTHYAFDSAGDGGTVRVVVVDLSSASTHDSDAWQNPAQAQDAWVAAVLDDAKARGIPAIVMGNASLQPGSHDDVRHDWQQVTGNDDLVAFGKLIADHGASAYFYEALDQNRFFYAPAGAQSPIPTWGTGSLNRGLPASEAGSGVRHDVSGELLVEVDGARRDPTTNRAPVNVRLIPVIQDLALDALDGTALQRGRTALFSALGRRPRSGGVEGTSSYVPLPAAARCPGTAGCASKVDPEVRFTSSDPDIGDFVATDPASPDPRSVKLGDDGKPVHDEHSTLFCAFNAGTTTVRVEAGGLSYSEPVTVSGGSPQRPCGTVPLVGAHIPKPPTIVQVAPSPSAAGAAPAGGGPPPAQSNHPPAQPVATPAPPPPAVAPAPPARPHLAPPAAARPVPPAPPASTPIVAAPPGRVLGALPPPPPTAARPSPPSGTAPVQVSAFANVPAAREEREEDVAPEDVQAASAYRQTDAAPTVPLTLAVLIIAAAAGTGVRRARGGGRGVQAVPVELHEPPLRTRRTR